MAAPGTGTPRWVKVFAIIGGVIALMAVIVLLAGGNHGPGRHLSEGNAAGGTVVVGAAGDPG